MPYIKTAYTGGDATARPGWWFSFDYDPDAIERLKAEVPASSRAWDEDNKRWWVEADYAERVVCIFPNFEAFLKQPRLL